MCHETISISSDCGTVLDGFDLTDDRDDAKSQSVLKELENIDDEADEHDLPFIKIDDDQASSL